MRILILFLFLLMNLSAYAQQTNNATINILGNNQLISINQMGLGNHSVNINAIGNQIPIIINQNSDLNRSFSLSIECYTNCASNPTIVNQY